MPGSFLPENPDQPMTQVDPQIIERLLKQPKLDYAKLIRLSKTDFKKYFDEFRLKNPGFHKTEFGAYFASVRESYLSATE
jgi:hypothetical protein